MPQTYSEAGVVTYPQVTEVDLSQYISSPDGEKNEIDRLRRPNDIWKKKAPTWHFYLTAYQGGEEFTVSDNVRKHFRENQSDYEDRLKGLHNMNYCESLVDFFTNFIFCESIDRSGGPQSTAFYDDFVGHVNLKGEDIDTVMRQVCDDMQIFGMSYVLVDAPPLPEQYDGEGNLRALTVQDLHDSGWRPYWVIVKPEEIVDWKIDETQRLIYAKRKQIIDNVYESGATQVERYSEFTAYSTVVTDVDVTQESKPRIVSKVRFANSLGYIPMAVARFKKDKIHPHLGLSFLRDFSYNQREILNLTSILQEFLYRQAFNVLAMETDSNVGIGNSSGTDTITPNNVIEYPKGAKAPSYVTPPVGPAEFISAERQKIKNEMFLRASQDAVNELFNGEKSSGFAQAQSFYKSVPFISSRASMLEALENELMGITCQMLGIPWDGKIRYKDRYEITNLTDALQQFIIIVKDLQLPSETFVREQLKRIVREYDGKLPIETLQAIYKEIDDADLKGWQDTQKFALVGNEAAGAPSKDQETMTIAEHAREGRVAVTDATKSRV